MPSEIQQNRYDQLIRRAGGIIGPGSKVSEVLAELFPVIDVERVPGELLALGGTFLAMGSQNLTGAVAEMATVQLFNPVGSGKLMTCSRVLASHTSTSTRVQWNIVTVPLSALSTNSRFRDSRFTGTDRPSGQVRSESLAASVTRAGQAFILEDEVLTLEDENSLFVLAPGTGWSIQMANTNQAFFVAFQWRERVVLEAELNF